MFDLVLYVVVWFDCVFPEFLSCFFSSVSLFFPVICKVPVALHLVPWCLLYDFLEQPSEVFIKKRGVVKECFF